MENSSVEMSLLTPEEQEQVQFIYDLIPVEDKQGISKDDILFVLDMIDEYLESVGLVKEDAESGELIYLDGDVDETEQLEFITRQAREAHRTLTSAQIQIILDGEMQYGIEQGWYEEED